MYKGDNLFLLFYRQDIKTGKLVVWILNFIWCIREIIYVILLF